MISLTREDLRRELPLLSDAQREKIMNAVLNYDNIALTGNIGTGKTFTAKVLGDAWRKSLSMFPHFIFVSALNTESLINKSVMQYAGLVIVDDVGIEDVETLHYGVKVKPIAHLLSMRYEYSLPTIITSNYSFPNLARRYGARVEDRVLSIFGEVKFTGHSLRKKITNNKINKNETI